MAVAQGSEYGTYFGPGSVEKPSAGRVAGPVHIRLLGEVELEVAELKVIHHVEPLVLIGADILCGGHKGWSFRSMGVAASGGGLIMFAKGYCTTSISLVNAPMLRHPKSVSAAPTRDQSTNLRPEPALGSTPTADTPQERLALMKVLVTRQGQRL